MRSYNQRMETSGVADRIALLAHDHLVGMYKDLGFQDKGKSEVRFAGGGWNSLVSEMVSLSRVTELTCPRHMNSRNISRGLEVCYDMRRTVVIVTVAIVDMCCYF